MNSLVEEHLKHICTAGFEICWCTDVIPEERLENNPCIIEIFIDHAAINFKRSSNVKKYYIRNVIARKAYLSSPISKT